MRIILRIDDIGRKRYRKIVPRMLNDLAKRGIPCVLGVIACELEDKDNYVEMLVHEGLGEKNEFALHGYYHRRDSEGNPEFSLLSESDAQKLIRQGKESMKKHLGITPITFIPPYNKASEETKEVLIKEGFKIYSGRKDECGDSALLLRGFNAATSRFHPHRLIPLKRVQEEYRKSMQQRKYAVIMIHPQDYILQKDEEYFEDIDLEKYEKYFIGLLEMLKADGSSFVLFRDMIL